MALTTDYLYTYALKLMRSNQAGRLSATEFAQNWNDSQAAIFEDLAGRFQAQAVGKTGPNTGLIQDKTILQKLSPFIKAGTITVTAGNGDKPDDFIFELAMRISGFDVIHIDHDQRASVNNSVIDPPNILANKYYVSEYQGYYSFLPSTVTTASIDYISTPPPIKWGFTIDPATGRQVYNAGLSVQPLWDEHTCREITKRMFKTIGISLHDDAFAQFGQSVIQTGE